MIRVALTTDRFGPAAVPFRTAGFEPVSLPCVRVEPASEEVLIKAREAASEAELLVVTSARTLDLLWPGAEMPFIDVAAVGERTSEAVAARGGRVVVSGRNGLADLIGRAGDRLTGSRVVFPHARADNAPLRLALETLREFTTNLREFEVYRTFPHPPGPAHAEAVAFASPSAVAGWHLSRSFDGLIVGVIGSTTSLAMGLHRTPDVCAPQPSYRSLAEALASYLEASP